jgi:hypothetical protein
MRLVVIATKEMIRELEKENSTICEELRERELDSHSMMNKVEEMQSMMAVNEREKEGDMKAIADLESRHALLCIELERLELKSGLGLGLKLGFKIEL